MMFSSSHVVSNNNYTIKEEHSAISIECRPLNFPMLLIIQPIPDS